MDCTSKSEMKMEMSEDEGGVRVGGDPKETEWSDGVVLHAIRQLMERRTREGERAGLSEKTSFYMEMRSRRTQGEASFVGVKSLGRCLRSSVCAVTVCFLEAEVLLRRLYGLPTHLKDGVTAFYWADKEPVRLWNGCPTASTVVLLLVGVPRQRSIRSVLSLLIQDLPSGRRGEVKNIVHADMEYVPALEVLALRTEEDWNLWLERHKQLLGDASQYGEVQRGGRIVLTQSSYRSGKEKVSSPTKRAVLGSIDGSSVMNVKANEPIQ